MTINDIHSCPNPKIENWNLSLGSWRDHNASSAL